MAKPKRYRVFPKQLQASVWALEMAKKWLSLSLTSYPGPGIAPWHNSISEMIVNLSDIIYRSFKTAEEINRSENENHS